MSKSVLVSAQQPTLSASETTRVIIVAIGGATCSGKTTLAKHLRGILPGSEIIHQDDFAPPQELIPIHPVHNVQDWDSPRGAIDWPRLTSFLAHAKSADGKFLEDHRSHDHLNEQKAVPIPDDLRDRWRRTFKAIETDYRARSIHIVWRLVDGFLLYWNKDVVATYDVRIFLRVPHEVLHKRRHERHGYHTAGEAPRLPAAACSRGAYLHPPALRLPKYSHPRRCSFSSLGVQSDPEGSLWRDPPHYWEQIVWPGYVEAHSGMFENGDVEHGAPRAPSEGTAGNGEGEGVRDLVVIEGLEISMEQAVDRCCELLKACVEARPAN